MERHNRQDLADSVPHRRARHRPLSVVSAQRSPRRQRRRSAHSERRKRARQLRPSVVSEQRRQVQRPRLSAVLERRRRARLQQLSQGLVRHKRARHQPLSGDSVRHRQAQRRRLSAVLERLKPAQLAVYRRLLVSVLLRRVSRLRLSVASVHRRPLLVASVSELLHSRRQRLLDFSEPVIFNDDVIGNFILIQFI